MLSCYSLLRPAGRRPDAGHIRLFVVMVPGRGDADPAYILSDEWDVHDSSWRALSICSNAAAVPLQLMVVLQYLLPQWPPQRGKPPSAAEAPPSPLP